MVFAGAAARFIHVRVYLLAGRSEGEQQALSQRILHALRELTPTAEQLTVDIREMNRETFSKRTRD